MATLFQKFRHVSLIILYHRLIAFLFNMDFKIDLIRLLICLYVVFIPCDIFPSFDIPLHCSTSKLPIIRWLYLIVRSINWSLIHDFSHSFRFFHVFTDFTTILF